MDHFSVPPNRQCRQIQVEMSRSSLFCVFLFLGYASAFWSWYKPRKNVNTECGYFHTLREGWFWDNPMTDFDTVKELNILKRFDQNKDGDLSGAERYQGVLDDVNATSSLNLQAGVRRCAFVEYLARERNMNKIVVSYFFDLIDRDNDDRLTLNDFNLDSTVFLKLFDANSDGRVGICEYFQGVMRSLQVAENRAYQIEERYEIIVNKFRKRFNIFRWMHDLASSWG